MAFELETSRTADAAKLAVLWRDRDKKPATPGSGGDSVPDHFVEDVFEGGILDAIIPPPAKPPTTNPDGSVTPSVVPEPILLRPVHHGHARTPEAHWRAIVNSVAGAVAAFGPTLDLSQVSDLADKLMGCLEWQGLHVVPTKPTKDMVQASLAALRRHNRVIGGELNVEEKHKWRLEQAVAAGSDWRASRDAWRTARARGPGDA